MLRNRESEQKNLTVKKNADDVRLGVRLLLVFVVCSKAHGFLNSD